VTSRPTACSRTCGLFQTFIGILLLETHFCADLYLKCGELNPSLPITLAFAGRASNGAGNGPTLGSLNRVAQGGHLSKGVLQESAALPI
jgi:hypothetical protein